MLTRTFMSILFAVLMTFPFLVVIFKLGSFQVSFAPETGWVFLSTFVQAFLSASLSVLFGLIGALGVLFYTRLGTFMAVIPNAAPVILLLIAVMRLFPWARGLSGIVFIHVLLNAGLLSLVFAESMRTKIGGMAELAWVEGASRFRFFTRVAVPLLRFDIALAFLFVFALCFASFAVPLAIGGARATTVEVLIYEKIRISGDWSEAIALSFLQTLIILLLSWFLSRMTSSKVQGAREKTISLLGWKYGVIVPAFGFSVLVIGLFSGVVVGARQAASLEFLKNEAVALLAGSILISFGVGLFVVILLLMFAYIHPTGVFRRLISGYAAPSSVLVGFSILILWRDLGFATYFKIIFALGLVIVPSFLRFRWIALLDALEGQVLVANSLGAGSLMTFKKIILPQVLKPAFFLGGIASLWAWGDFALSSVIAERSVTLAMAMRAMMDSYRLDIATFLSWFVILGGLLTLGLFVGVGNVLGQKFKT